MRAALSFLAARRWAGVGLALLVEVLALALLALAPSSAVVGLPAAVAASIAGTVAVVYGVGEGVALALVGAFVFGALGGWGPGELAALAVWPALVGAAGGFARRVEHQRRQLRRLVNAHEEERRTLAATLHDQSAQTLAGALMTLGAPNGTSQASELIKETIRELRALAVDLSPKALEDYGLCPALTRLAETVTEQTPLTVRVACDWANRLPTECERALFRLVQSALGEAIERDVDTVDISLSGEQDAVVLTLTAHGVAGDEATLPEPASEHLRLLGGKIRATRSDAGAVLTAELPLPVAVG